MDVGVQKFISRSSDGRALIGREDPFVGLAFVDGTCSSSVSSLICEDATDVVDDIVSRCMPNRLDINQPRTPSDDPLAGLAIENVAVVKYGFWDRRMDLGEPSGEAGSDFDPRRIVERDECDHASANPDVSFSVIGSADTSSESLLKLLKVRNKRR